MKIINQATDEDQLGSSDLREQIEKVLRPNLKFHASDAPLGADQNLGELGLDSLASINLLFDLETEFGVSIPDEALDENTFATLANLEAVITQSLKG